MSRFFCEKTSGPNLLHFFGLLENCRAPFPSFNLYWPKQSSGCAVLLAQVDDRPSAGTHIKTVVVVVVVVGLGESCLPDKCEVIQPRDVFINACNVGYIMLYLAFSKDGTLRFQQSKFGCFKGAWSSFLSQGQGECGFDHSLVLDVVLSWGVASTMCFSARVSFAFGPVAFTVRSPSETAGDHTRGEGTEKSG